VHHIAALRHSSNKTTNQFTTKITAGHSLKQNVTPHATHPSFLYSVTTVMGV